MASGTEERRRWRIVELAQLAQAEAGEAGTEGAGTEGAATEGAATEEMATADLAGVLARWHAAEWGHLYDPAVWDEEVARREFEEQDVPGRIPTTFVAFGDHGEPLGSISIVADDDLPGFGHLTPWLASLYVIPEARGHGLGSALLAYAIDQTRRQGHTAVHLFTPDQEPWYARLGWETVASATAGTRPATVMRLRLDEQNTP
jgi:GNAT superfamily N-acetyltransferase